MTKQELFDLINAGFTKEDILKLNASKEFNDTPLKDESNAKDEDAQNDVVEEKKEEKKEEKADNSTFAFSNMFDEMNAKIESLTKAVRTNNIMSDNFGEESKKTTDDIISSIILPRKEN